MAIVAALIGFAAFDLTTPGSVEWRSTTLGDVPAERAEDLVLQDRLGDVVWASIGFSIYRSRGSEPFEAIQTLRPSPSEAWAGYSATFRHLFRYQELVELLAVSDQELVAFAGGEAFHIDLVAGTAESVHTLRYYGRGIGRGLMPHGLTMDDLGHLYYGEYPTRTMGPEDTVRIYRSTDHGRSWHVAHEFPGGFARHIHAVQWDPLARLLWVSTGDTDEESRIGYSSDRGRSFHWVGSGDQRFRAVSLLFQSDRVRWAMDAPRTDSRLISWHRTRKVIEVSETILPAPGYYVRPIDASRAVVTLAERDAAVVLFGNALPRVLFRWDVVPNPDRPHPAVRLLRSSTRPDPEALLLNPLRTEQDGTALYRVGVEHAIDAVTPWSPPAR